VLGILLEVLNMFVIYLHLIIADYVFSITLLFFRFIFDCGIIRNKRYAKLVSELLMMIKS